MAQAAEDFPHFAAYYLYYPAVDKTGLKGGWDFTLNWSSGDLIARLLRHFADAGIEIED